MNDTGIRPEVIEEIRNLAQKYDIEQVISEGIESERKYPLWDRYIILRN